MYNIKKVNMEDVRYMNDNYYKYISAPMDDMWELGIIAKGNYYLIGDNIGYFVLGNENALLQFHIEASHLNLSRDLFLDILDKFDITNAFVSTYEPMYLALCLDNSISVKTEAYLYIENENVVIEKPMKELESSVATLADLKDIVRYHKDKVDIEGDWLQGYLEMLISNKSLMLYKINGDMVGTGEMRESAKNKNFANLGMTVSKDYRKKSVGSYILSSIRVIANDKGLETICGTDVRNEASQRTIMKCGYYPYHRVLKIVFK